MVHARGPAPRDLPAGSRPDTSGRWLRLFRGQQSEIRQLRHWLTALLPDGLERDDLTSVAVELATNAIQHTASGQSGWFTVELARHGHVAGIAVTDEGGPGGPQPSDDPMSDCGRGLVIVQALAQSWGVRGDSRGRTVWAEVACRPRPRLRPRRLPARSACPARCLPGRLPAARPALPDGSRSAFRRAQPGQDAARPGTRSARRPGAQAEDGVPGGPPGRTSPPDR